MLKVLQTSLESTMSRIPAIDLVTQILFVCKKLRFLVSCFPLHAALFGRMALCFLPNTKLVEVVQLLFCHLTFILLLFHMVLTPHIEFFGFFSTLTIILSESLMFMLPMIQGKDPRCGVGQLTICLQVLRSCVVTSIWLKWPLTKTTFCLFARQLGKGKPSTTCVINWVFFIPIQTTTRVEGSGTLGPTFELAQTAY